MLCYADDAHADTLPRRLIAPDFYACLIAFLHADIFWPRFSLRHAIFAMFYRRHTPLPPCRFAYIIIYAAFRHTIYVIMALAILISSIAYALRRLGAAIVKRDMLTLR